MPLLAGRAPEWIDAEREPHVIWVNETFARTYLDNKAIGELITLEDKKMEIVGVVGDIRTFGLNEDNPSIRLSDPPQSGGIARTSCRLVVRTTADPGVTRIRAARRCRSCRL